MIARLSKSAMRNTAGSRGLSHVARASYRRRRAAFFEAGFATTLCRTTGVGCAAGAGSASCAGFVTTGPYLRFQQRPLVPVRRALDAIVRHVTDRGQQPNDDVGTGRHQCIPDAGRRHNRLPDPEAMVRHGGLYGMAPEQRQSAVHMPAAVGAKRSWLAVESLGRDLALAARQSTQRVAQPVRYLLALFWRKRLR